MDIKPRIAIVGATGLVGSSLIELVNEGHLPVADVHLLASINSAGERLEVLGKYRRVELLEQFSFEEVDLALFAVPAKVAVEYIAKATDAGARVVDVSGAYAADPSVLLAAAGVNDGLLTEHEAQLVAAPTAAALVMARALKPLHDAAQLMRVTATICEPASYFGSAGVNELAQQAVKLLSGQDNDAKQKLAFNTQTHLERIEDSGHTRLELLSAFEVLRLLGQSHLEINVSALQTSVFYGHTITLHLATAQHLPVEVAEQLLKEAGLAFLPEGKSAPSALTDAVGTNEIWVSRIRPDMASKNGLNLTLVSDNLRVGSALNMLLIAQKWLKDH